MDTIAFEHGIKDDMLAPSKKLIARAVPVPGGYLAQFSAPGLIPAFVGLDQEEPDVFETMAEAEVAAMRAMMGVANAPRKSQNTGRTERYKKLTGPEFAVLLAEAGLSVNLFAFIYGTSADRVHAWINGVENVPHPARVLLEIFKAHPMAIDVAESVTEAVTEARKPR